MPNNRTNRPAGRSRGEHSEPAARPQSRRAAARAEVPQGRRASASEPAQPVRRAPRRRWTRRNGGQRHAAARLQPGGAIPAADQGRGGGACEAHRARRPRGQGADDQLQPPARDLERAEVSEPRAATDRSDSGGHSRADPGDGEIRLAAWLQVLDDATLWIRQSIQRALANTSRTIRIPEPHRAAPAQARGDARL